jgi:hypothetical protein
MKNYWYFIVDGYKALFGYMLERLIKEMFWPEDYWRLNYEFRIVILVGNDSFE